MKSKVFTTYQIDDPTLAAQELVEGISQGFTLEKNTAGILLCYSDMDVNALIGTLSTLLPYDVMGCTCIAAMDQQDGFHEMGATLMVFTADDCTFATAKSGEITPDNVEAEMRAAYDAACESLDGVPGLIFALPPYNLHIMLDEYVNLLNKIAEGVPVIGGLPSNHSNVDINATFLNDTLQPGAMALLAIKGNIRPVFSLQNITGAKVERKRKVTRARNNVVYEVGNQRFTDYMEELGISGEKLTDSNKSYFFVANPLILENIPQAEDPGFSFARTLHEVNMEEGTGTAIGMVPEGATLSICTLSRRDIEKSAVLAMADLAEKMAPGKAEGYQYSTMLAISCIGRHLLLLPANHAEVDCLLAQFPEDMQMAGFYSFGEISPLPNKNSVFNFAYNESLVLCAF